MRVNLVSKIKISGIIFLVLFLILEIYNLSKIFPGNNLTVHFLDVGQGDSILIESPSHKKILVDGGPDNAVDVELGNILGYGKNEKKIDYVFATHDDLDHIFGLIKIMSTHDVDYLFLSVASSTNPLMKKLLETASSNNAHLIEIKEPSYLDLGDGVIVKILFPVTDMKNTEDGNSASIVTQIIYKENKILLTGDLGISGEEFLVKTYGESLRSDILKLGHHGSDTSSSPIFLQTVKPKFAVVSAGVNNKFGHPHKSVVELCEKLGINIFSTQKENTISFELDGERIRKF